MRNSISIIIIIIMFKLASCLIYTPTLLEYCYCMWVRSVNKMLPSVKFAEDKVLTFLIPLEKC